MPLGQNAFSEAEGGVPFALDRFNKKDFVRGKRKFPRELSGIFDRLYNGENVPKIKPSAYKRARFGFPMLFKYSPKWAAQLPFYDVHPMPILLAKYDDGFLGLNIHYLPWAKRLQLADRIIRASKNRKRITYPQIKRAWQQLRLPMGYSYLIIRRYLASHIQTDIAVFTWETYRAAAVNIPGKWRKKSEKAVFAAMAQKWRDHVQKTKAKNKQAKVTRTKSTRRRK